MVASLRAPLRLRTAFRITGERRTHERVLARNARHDRDFERESSRLDDACAIGDAPFAGDSNKERRSNLWQ